MKIKAIFDLQNIHFMCYYKSIKLYSTALSYVNKNRNDIYVIELLLICEKC